MTRDYKSRVTSIVWMVGIDKRMAQGRNQGAADLALTRGNAHPYGLAIRVGLSSNIPRLMRMGGHARTTLTRRAGARADSSVRNASQQELGCVTALAFASWSVGRVDECGGLLTRRRPSASRRCKSSTLRHRGLAQRTGQLAYNRQTRVRLPHPLPTWCRSSAVEPWGRGFESHRHQPSLA